MPHVREPRIPIRPLEMAVLMFHLYQAAKDADIGWMDCNHTLGFISHEMNRKPAKIRKSLVESALFCCNMLAEKKKFWHPKGDSFDEFLEHLITATQKDLNFDRFTNLLEENKKKTP